MLYKIIISIVLMQSLAQAQSSSFAVVNTPKEQSVQMDAALLNKIAEFDPQFKVFRSAQYQSQIPTYFEGSSHEIPMGVIADWNGDQVLDIALMGESKSPRNGQISVKVIVVLSPRRSKDEYSILLVKEWSQADYQIPGTPSLISATKNIQGWRIYLSLATAEEKKSHRLSSRLPALKIESDSFVEGFYTFQGNQMRRTVAANQTIKKSISPRIPSQVPSKKKKF